MPIKGLTTDVRPAFPNLGKLRKGGKKTSETRPGPDLEYFRFTSEQPEIEAAFYGAYPAQPQSINVFLPNKAIDNVWECWQEHWVAGGLVHRCDGETCVVWQDGNGEYHDEPKSCPGECKPVGRLQVLLPELLQAGFVGYVTFETHSKHDIMSIQACLEDASGKANGHGLTGIEFRLYREPQKISTPMVDKDTGEIKRVRRQKWLCKLTPTVRWVQAQLAQAEHLQLAMPEQEPERAQVLELPEPPYDDDDVEDAEFTEEPEEEPAHWYDGKTKTIAAWLKTKRGISIDDLHNHDVHLKQFKTREEFIEWASGSDCEAIAILVKSDRADDAKQPALVEA